MKIPTEARIKKWSLNNLVRNRPNKIAKGLTYTLERNKRKSSRHLSKSKLSEDASTLSVYGTLDRLGRGKWMKFTKIKIAHPTDPGYFKEVYVLTKNKKKFL